MVAVATSSGICSFSMMISMMAHIIPHTIGISFLMIISNDGSCSKDYYNIDRMVDTYNQLYTQFWIHTLNILLL